MASSIVREVLIQLRVKMEKLKAEAPDTSSYVAAYQRAFKSIETEHEAMRKRLVASMSVAHQVSSSGPVNFNQARAAMAFDRPTLTPGFTNPGRPAIPAGPSGTAPIGGLQQAEYRRIQQAGISAYTNIAASAESSASRQLTAIERVRLGFEHSYEDMKKRAAAGLSIVATVATPSSGTPAAAPGAPAGNASASPVAPAVTSNVAHQSEAYLRAGDSFKVAGEGAFMFARGVAFLNVENEKDLATAVKRIAVYQGYFDIYKGGFDVVKGSAQGVKALAIAHSSASVAAGIQAGTTGALTVSLIAARGAALSLWTALTGPVGLAILGTAAVAGTAYVAYNYMTDASAEAAKAAHKLADAEDASAVRRIKALNLLGAAQRAMALNELDFNKATELRSIHLAGRGVGLIEAAGQIQADQIEARKRGLEAILKHSDAVAGKTEFLGQSAGFFPEDSKDGFKDKIASGREYLKVLASINKPQAVLREVEGIGGGYAQDLAKLGSDQEAIQKRLTELRERDMGPVKRAIQLQEDKVKLIKQERETAKANYDLLGKQLDRAGELRKAHEGSLSAVNQLAKSLQADKLTDLQKIGQLNRFDQQRAKGIGERLAGANGDVEKAGLRKDEIEFLKSNSLAKASIEKYEIGKGRAIGGEQILANLGQTTISEIDSLRGGGPTGAKREDVLASQQNAAMAALSHVKQQENELLNQYRAEQDKLLEVATQLADQTRLIAVFEAAMKEKDAAIDRIAKAGGVSEKEVQAQIKREITASLLPSRGAGR